MKILGINIGKSQQNYNASSHSAGRAFDIGLDDLGQWRSVFATMSAIFNGGGGAIKYTDPASQLAQSLMSWPYACIDRIAKEIMQAEWKLYRRTKGEWQPVDERDFKASAAMTVLEEPFSYGTEATLKESIVRQIDATGFSVCTKTRFNGKDVTGIVPVNPATLTPHRLPDGRIIGWENDRGQSFAPEDVLFIHYPDPRNVFYPLSPLAAASYGIDIGNSTFDFNSKLLKNDGRPSGWFIPKQEQPLTQPQIDAVKKWMKDTKGKVGGYEMPPMGGDIKLTGHTPKDMDYANGLQIASVEVCNAFGYPRPLITGEQINKSVMEVLVYGKNNACIIPRMMVIETAITMQIIRPMLGPDYWLAFDRPKMVFSDEARNLLEEIRLGVRTINERRAELGLDEVEWGSTPPRQSAQPIDTAALMQQIQEPKRIEEAIIKVLPETTIPVLPTRKIIDRAVEWKSFDGIVRTAERPFKASIMRSFARQSRQVQDEIKNRAKTGQMVDGSVFHTFNAEADFQKAALEHVENGMQSGRDRAALLTKRDVPDSPRLGQLAATYAQEQAAVITDTTAKRIGEYCATHVIGNAEKELEQMLAVDLSTFLSDIDKLIADTTRAETIAESMTVASVNDGLRSAFVDVGVEKKEWLSQQDGLVRDGHYNHNLDGTVIRLNEKFQTGTPGGLDYPGDPFGDAGDIINCRCTVLPVLEEE